MVIQRLGEAKGWTVFHLPSTPDWKSNTVLPGARHPSSRPARRRRPRPPVPFLRARRPELRVAALARPVRWRARGVAHGNPCPLNGAMPPGVARDARARRRRQRVEGALRRGRRRDGSARVGAEECVAGMVEAFMTRADVLSASASMQPAWALVF